MMKKDLKSKLKKVLIFCVVAAAIAFPITQLAFRNGGHYDLAMEYFNTDTEFISGCGEYISHGPVISGELRTYSEGKGDAVLKFDVKTNKGKYDVILIMERQDREWQIIGSRIE
ncbi:MAG: hypothetical protein IKM61_08800 [Eubacteriaceae bacterium]|nr:hypothetical protein [Eubacteriaceae bacterium]